VSNCRRCHRSTLVLSVLALLVTGAVGEAQVAPARAPTIANPTTPHAECVEYAGGRPAQLSGAFVPSVQLLIACTEALDNVIRTETAPTVKAEADLHKLLLSDYLAYLNLKKWHEAVQAAAKTRKFNTKEFVVPDIDRAQLRQTFNALSSRLHDALADHALLQPFAANLITGFVFATVGAQTAVADSSSSNADKIEKAQPTGYVKWETLHFFAEPDRFADMSISGTDGFMPSLVLVQPAAPAAGPLATFQQTFVWSARVNTNVHAGDRAEVRLFAGGGQAILTSLNELLDDSSTSATVVTPAANRTGRSSGFGEFGAGFSLYSESIDVVHVSRGLFAPSMAVEAGLRLDDRFKAAGVLAKAFKAPTRRFFFRFVLEPLQLMNKTGADSQSLTFGFEVDYQRAWRADDLMVPAGNRILIRADLNLFKAVQSAK